MSIRFAGALVLAVLLAGCMNRQPADQSFGPSEEWRLRTLEEKSLVFQNGQMELASRVNELEQRVKQMETASPIEQDIVEDAQPLMSSEAMPAPAQQGEGAPAGMKPQATSPDMRKTKAKASKPASKPDKKTVKRASKPKKTKAAVVPGKSMYKAALNKVLAGKAVAGRKGMQSFLSKYPKSPLAPNAGYWLGETYYHQKRFAEAVLSFKKVHQKYPQHDKAAAALLKIGYSYANLDDVENARFYLNVLVQDYPKTEAAAKARARLKKLR